MANLGKLFVIGTPIGHRDDLSFRARAQMLALSQFCAEDTRELKKLLSMYDISTEGKEFFSFAQHNMKESVLRAIEILRSGKDLGLVSDRGTPAISDPGALLVKAAWEEGVSVVPIPGASSVVTLFSVSGFLESQFFFQGFLPLKEKDREGFYKQMSKLGHPFCLFESPKRIKDTLKELAEKFPKGEVVIGREMTKSFEEFQKFPLAKIPTLTEKGEFALFVNPGVRLEESDWQWELEARLSSDKEWAKKVAEKYGIRANEIYNALQKNKS